jgi:hypothetical protein
VVNELIKGEKAVLPRHLKHEWNQRKNKNVISKAGIRASGQMRVFYRNVYDRKKFVPDTVPIALKYFS